MSRAQAEVDRAFDRAQIARCLELAEQYRGRTSPNPIVGCVVVDKRGRVIAEGAHQKAGTDHAERVALKKLKGRAPGGTLYVNLEPCAHHGRTPPCAPYVVESGVARVVIGALDPIAGHGGGAKLLRRAGVKVTAGVLREACERANLPFFTVARLGRPAFTLKAAITLDGKIATVEGDSKWITGEAARADVMKQRSAHDAILCGIGTVLADDPQLTARVKGGRDPVRVVLDSHLRTPPGARVLPAIIACAADAPPEREAALTAAGAMIWRGLALPDVAARLTSIGAQSVLVEGGGEVHASFLGAGLADRLILYIAPKVVGGAGKSWVRGAGVAALRDAYRFELDDQITFSDGDLRLMLSARAPDRR